MGEIVQSTNHVIDSEAFRATLRAWGQEHFRSFPWRQTTDPYRILMAEVMLHRTQASQVVPVYASFVQRYPAAPAVASAPKDELHRVLYSLGLRWRIDLIHDMIECLTTGFGGEVPQGKAALLSLPGVSEYIAGAVRCFSWNLREPLIDTNTVRVIGRLFGQEIKPSSRRNRRFRELIAALVDPEEPRVYNYALLDLAAQVCAKKRPPHCTQCPLFTCCLYGTETPVGRAEDQRR